MSNKNYFGKIYRVKTPGRKEKYLLFSELGVLCVFARVISFAALESNS